MLHDASIMFPTPKYTHGTDAHRIRKCFQSDYSGNYQEDLATEGERPPALLELKQCDVLESFVHGKQLKQLKQTASLILCVLDV